MVLDRVFTFVSFFFLFYSNTYTTLTFDVSVIRHRSMTNTKSSSSPSSFLGCDIRITIGITFFILSALIYHRHNLTIHNYLSPPCIDNQNNNNNNSPNPSNSQNSFLNSIESTNLLRAVELKNKTFQNFVFLNQMPMAAAKSMHYLLNALSDKHNFTYTHLAYPEKQSTLYSNRWIEHMNSTENILPAVLNGIRKNDQKFLLNSPHFTVNGALIRREVPELAVPPTV